MFTLNAKLEDQIEVEGTTYSLDMTFDNVLLFLDVIQDESLTNFEQIHYGLLAMLGTVPDIEIETQLELLNFIIESFIHGDHEKEVVLDIEGNEMPEVRKAPVYDLKIDAELIYASFLKDYQIDLIEQQGKLDWRQFKVLLRHLSDDTKFSQIVGIRSQKLPTGKHMAGERKRLKELKKKFALPNTEVEDLD